MTDAAEAGRDLRGAVGGRCERRPSKPARLRAGDATAGRRCRQPKSDQRQRLGRHSRSRRRPATSCARGAPDARMRGRRAGHGGEVLGLAAAPAAPQTEKAPRINQVDPAVGKRMRQGDYEIEPNRRVRHPTTRATTSASPDDVHPTAVAGAQRPDPAACRRRTLRPRASCRVV